MSPHAVMGINGHESVGGGCSGPGAALAPITRWMGPGLEPCLRAHARGSPCGHVLPCSNGWATLPGLGMITRAGMLAVCIALLLTAAEPKPITCSLGEAAGQPDEGGRRPNVLSEYCGEMEAQRWL